MLQEDKYFQTLNRDELWQRYCGFLDLSVDEFIEMQKQLLMDEIEQVSNSVLGKKIMDNRKPTSVDEFRQIVPLTSYEDYEPYLNERREDALNVKPYLWCHSSGKGGRFKWIPHSREGVQRSVRYWLAAFILASSNKKGEINIRPGFRLLATLPPAPYTSGSSMIALSQHVSLKAIPPFEEAQTTEFQDRIKKGFQTAMKEGVDVMGSLTSILVRMGQEFTQQTRTMKFSTSMLHPSILFRLIRALLSSKIEKRGILPKDLWKAKGIVAGGLDTAIYKGDILRYWGSLPFELYASTEAFVLAMESWKKNGMIFLPDMVFLEFIPYEEHLKHRNDKDYLPSTVLLDELEAGKLYEVIITQFYGMPLLRYQIDDLIKVIALKDEGTGINLPHIVFQRRTTDVISLAGLAELDEKTIWQAIANTGIKYNDWSAVKEYDNNRTFLRIYIELKEERQASDVECMIDEQLRIVDTDYKDINSYLQLRPVKVSLLYPGTFQLYMEEKRKEGADLAHMKPARINAPDMVIHRLHKLSEMAK